MLALCGDSFSVGQADGAVVSAQKTFEQIRNSQHLLFTLIINENRI